MNHPSAEFQAFINCPTLLPLGLKGISNFNLPTTNTSIVLPDKLPFFLGKRMEIYLIELLKCSNEYALKYAGIQVVDNNQTLGELDLIVEEKTGGWIHVETATKFYLFNPLRSGDFIDKWIGPNNRDALRFKMNKLLGRQFPLLKNDRVQEIMPDLPANVKQQLLLKGQLFLPWAMVDFDFETLNPDCMAGYWISEGAFNTWDHSINKYQVVQKDRWLLAPTDDGDGMLDFNAVQESIFDSLKEGLSPLLWVKELRSGKMFRLFVVFWA